MIIRNPKLIRECRSKGRCDFCAKPCKKREGAHLVSRGAGGSDLKCNLVCLGSSNEPISVSCRCHSLSHAGKPPTHQDLLSIIAKREKVTEAVIVEVGRFIYNLDKHASSYAIQEGLLKLSEAARKIATRELTEAGKL